MKPRTVARPTIFLGKLWTSRLPSMRRNRSTWLGSWMTTVHTGWLIAAFFLREMSGSSGTVSFKSVESRFQIQQVCDEEVLEALRYVGRRWRVRFWPLWRQKWVSKRKEVLLDVEREGTHQICSFMWADNSWIMQLLKDLIEEAGKVELEPKPASLWWRSTHASEEEEDIILGTSKGCYDFLFEDEFRTLGCAMNRQGRTCDAAGERMQSANKACWKDTLSAFGGPHGCRLLLWK